MSSVYKQISDLGHFAGVTTVIRFYYHNFNLYDYGMQ